MCAECPVPTCNSVYECGAVKKLCQTDKSIGHIPAHNHKPANILI